MTRRNLVAGNWKMHGSVELINAMVQTFATPPMQVDVVLFPPYVYLPALQQQAKNTDLAYGAQNCAAHTQGAFTGEISPLMLKELGCRYVILGHSERRALYGETNDVIAEKIMTALDCDLIPIFCIGETAEQRAANATMQVLQNQLAAILTLPDAQAILSEIIIAYEPVWAIGTGKTATPELAQETHSQIRQFLAQYHPSTAEQMQLLYGGSVKADNAAQLIAMPDIDGFLVGGASLDPTQFLLICQAAGR